MKPSVNYSPDIPLLYKITRRQGVDLTLKTNGNLCGLKVMDYQRRYYL